MKIVNICFARKVQGSRKKERIVRVRLTRKILRHLVSVVKNYNLVAGCNSECFAVQCEAHRLVEISGQLYELLRLGSADKNHFPCLVCCNSNAAVKRIKQFGYIRRIGAGEWGMGFAHNG